MESGNYHTATATSVIDIQSISRFFGNKCAVNNLSLSINPGQAVGFIGPNGAGKTTTMRILSTLDEPDLGDAFVSGYSVVDDPDKVRFRLGFMPDAYGAYANVSCVEYLDFFARSYGLVGRERSAAINYVLDFTNMRHMMHDPMTGLSKGMKQRLCLGRALIHNPSVLILDEPAAGLDPRARIELKDMIGQLVAEGKSLLISSHILTELAEMCDRVAIIELGQLLATGTVDEILHDFTGRQTEEGAMLSVLIEVLDDPKPLIKYLSEKEGMSKVRFNSPHIQFEYPDQPAMRADLLKELVQAGFPIVHFATKQRSLEEAFLRATKGNVQ